MKIRPQASKGSKPAATWVWIKKGPFSGQFSGLTTVGYGGTVRGAACKIQARFAAEIEIQ